MGECIFCRIAGKEMPAAEILDDDAAFAFLDVSPLAQGHVLLIPRTHYETVDEMPADVASDVFRHIPRLVKAVQGATGCEGVNVLQNNGRTAHQFVPHVHVHIIPRFDQDAFSFNWPAGSYAEGQMEEMCRKIRENM